MIGIRTGKVTVEIETDDIDPVCGAKILDVVPKTFAEKVALTILAGQEMNYEEFLAKNPEIKHIKVFQDGHLLEVTPTEEERVENIKNKKEEIIRIGEEAIDEQHMQKL